MTDPKEKLAEELLEHMKAKDADTTLTDQMEAFAKQKNMRPGQITGLYYSKVRTDYEKWLQAQKFRSKQTDIHNRGEKKEQPAPYKPQASAQPIKPTQKEVEAIEDTRKLQEEIEFLKRQARLLKNRLEEANKTPKVDEQTLKMRIAFMKLKEQTVKDPFQKLIIEPWLKELKQAAEKMENEAVEQQKTKAFYESIQP